MLARCPTHLSCWTRSLNILGGSDERFIAFHCCPVVGCGCRCVRFDLVKVEVARSAVMLRISPCPTGVTWYLPKEMVYFVSLCLSTRLLSATQGQTVVRLRGRGSAGARPACKNARPERLLQLHFPAQPKHLLLFFSATIFLSQKAFFSTPPSSIALFTALHIRRKGVVFSAARSRYRPGPSPTKRNAFFFLPQH